MNMPKDRLKDVRNDYDVIVIGSGLAGLTCANVLAKAGRSVLLLEQHYNFGGMATWFRRPGGRIFDISLHGFPVGMIKSCRRYWTEEIAGNIRQLKGIRFDNPQFTLETTFDRADFTRLLTERFGVEAATVEAFFDTSRGMDFYDDQTMTTRELFQRFFPGRTDVWRLLMEPINYANGSTLDDPAISYGIVFSNFMSKGVYIYQGGTDDLIFKMKTELKRNGVDLRQQVLVERILVEDGRACGVVADGRAIRAGSVVSNANLKNTVLKMLDPSVVPEDYLDEVRRVRLANSSCQVYMAVRQGERIPYVGDLLFTSTWPEFDFEAMCAREVTSRTFSLYYPDTRPHHPERYYIVSSTNANWVDWADLDEATYQREKQRLIDATIVGLEKYLPGVSSIIDHVEASTPRTFAHYTQHMLGATFGTKFEGLKASMDLPKRVPGLFHTGSVGIIMSGWLGTINYGVIVANEVDGFLGAGAAARAS
ncbi:MAG: all-trans-retinol 13,14-reductase [Phycisphaerae bacterium]